jgi:hypothetical protein
MFWVFGALAKLCSGSWNDKFLLNAIGTYEMAICKPKERIVL